MYNDLFIYPFWMTDKKDKVAIIGAGMTGTSLCRYSKIFDWNKVDWFDEDYAGYKIGTQIVLVSSANFSDYDKVIIASGDCLNCNELSEKLKAEGVLSDRIIIYDRQDEDQYSLLLDWYYEKYRKNDNRKSIKCRFIDVPYYVLPGLLDRIGNIKLEYSATDPQLVIYGYMCGAKCEYPFSEKEGVIKVGYWPTEPYLPDFSVLDYAFSGRQVGIDRNIYCRAYWPGKEIQDRKAFQDNKLFDRKFCNFISSNDHRGDGALLRKYFFCKLSEYKRVDSPGSVLNNMGNVIEPFNGNWRASKLDFIGNYKFTIAFENNMLDGYTTEKLFDPLSKGSVPIYWGNPLIGQFVNKDSYIDCRDYDYDFDAVIEQVQRVDNDIDLYMRMVTAKPMKGEYFANESISENDWWERIIEAIH